jgi:hypothetical protein
VALRAGLKKRGLTYSASNISTPSSQRRLNELDQALAEEAPLLRAEARARGRRDPKGQEVLGGN